MVNGGEKKKKSPKRKEVEEDAFVAMCGISF